MTLKAQLGSVRFLKRGESIGYGATYRCSKDMKVGTVSVGYGDGYPRHAKSGTPVLIRGKKAALVGRVSMDLISIDLSDCPEAQIGDEVTLWGEGLPIETVAACADTIGYELLCKVTERVPKIQTEL